MTVRCGGATSRPRAGVPEVNAVSGALITEGLLSISPWLLPFAALVDSFILSATAECSGDPPAMPTFDSTDVTNLIGGLLNPNAPITLQKVKDALLNWLWDRLCECSNGQLTVTPIIAPPAGATTIGLTPSVPCFAGSYVGRPAFRSSTAGIDTWADVTARTLGTNGLFHQLIGATQAYQIYGIPTGATLITSSWQNPPLVSCDCTNSTAIAVQFYDAAFTAIGGLISLNHSDLVGVCIGSSSVAVPATARWWKCVVDSGVLGGCGQLAGDLVVSTQVWCGGGPLGIQGCCPPDPSILIGIQNILQLVANLSRGFGAPPTATVDGVRHSNLSGHGSFTLSGKPIAIRVEMTTLPSGVHVEIGTPTFYWDAGFITPIAGGSPLRGQRLVFNPETMALPALTDQIGYTLEHGTVVDVVELLPVTP